MRDIPRWEILHITLCALPSPQHDPHFGEYRLEYDIKLLTSTAVELPRGGEVSPGNAFFRRCKRVSFLTEN
jgi:hypothetical protein